MSTATTQHHPPSVSTQEVRRALGRVAVSADFRRSPRLVELLEYLVERCLTLPGSPATQYDIGVEVYGKPGNFDPKEDPMVRVEVGRLRKTLGSYYTGPGASDPIRIEIPRGSYQPTIDWHTPFGQDSGADADASQRDSGETPMIAIFPFSDQKTFDLDDLPEELAEHITAEFARFEHFKVINFEAAKAAKARCGDAVTAATELGLTYALTGRIRQRNNSLSIHLQLMDCLSMVQLWDEEFTADISSGSLGQLESLVTATVAGQLADHHGYILRRMGGAVTERSSTSQRPSAFTATLLCLDYLYNPGTFTLATAIAALESSQEDERRNAATAALLGNCYLDLCSHDLGGGAKEVELARSVLTRAAALAPTHPYVLHGRAYLALVDREPEEAIIASRALHEQNPNAPFTSGSASLFLACAGEYEESLAIYHHCLSLQTAMATWTKLIPCICALARQATSDALHAAKAFDNPDIFWSPLLKSACFALSERLESAGREYGKLLAICPDFETRQHSLMRYWLQDEALITQIERGLQLARGFHRHH